MSPQNIAFAQHPLLSLQISVFATSQLIEVFRGYKEKSHLLLLDMGTSTKCECQSSLCKVPTLANFTPARYHHSCSRFFPVWLNTWHSYVEATCMLQSRVWASSLFIFLESRWFPKTHQGQDRNHLHSQADVFPTTEGLFTSLMRWSSPLDPYQTLIGSRQLVCSHFVAVLWPTLTNKMS